jgi:uncharacterized protein (TIGR03437 family)
MKGKMESRVWTVVLLALLAPGSGRTQSILQTLLAASANGVPELTAVLNIPSAVTTDQSGNIYVALKGAHQLVRIDSAGKVWQFAGNGQSGYTGDGGSALLATFLAPVSLAVDAAGNVYVADGQANAVRRIGTDGTISTLAGTGVSGYSGDGGPANKATLDNPSAVAVDASGDVLIADTWNNVVRIVKPNGQIATFAGTGAQGSAATAGPALANPLNFPAGLAADSLGDIYIADTGNNWVQLVTPDGTMTRYAGANPLQGTPIGGGGNPTIAIDATLSQPTSLALDAAGNLYLSEYGTPRVYQVAPNGTIASYAGTGKPGTVGDGGLARLAELNVLGIGTDSNGNLLIADGVSNRVRIVTAANGIINTLAGNGQTSVNPQGLAVSGNVLYFSDPANNVVRQIDLTTGQATLTAGDGLPNYFGDAGLAVYASLKGPEGLAVDNSGNLYIADSNNNVVRVVYPNGIINTFAGNGTAATAGDGGSAVSANLNLPFAVAADSSGNVYIAERTGEVIRKVGSTGIITTVAGTGVPGQPAAESDYALNEKLNNPQGLAVEAAGTLLIADSNNNRIRRLYPDGTLTTVAGSKTGGFSGDGGPATSATLSDPTAVTVDAAGNIYIADTGNQRIRRVDTSGIISTVAGNGKAGYNGDGSPATAYWLNGPAGVASASACSLDIADTLNSRIRQLTSPVSYTITTNPAGLEISIDGQTMATPATAQLSPGTTHSVSAPSPQSGSTGTEYLAPAVQSINVTCGQAQVSLTVNFNVQYALTVGADAGGTVTPSSSFQNAGASVTLQAVANTGYVFTGWEGNCTGTGSCALVMNGPQSVKADFAPVQTLPAAIASGGVVGAGLSAPFVTTLSTNAIATVFGNNFAPAGTLAVANSGNLVEGAVSTELDGVCVVVGGNKTPVLTVTPTQINFQVPQVPGSGSVEVQVMTACGTGSQLSSDAVTVPVASVTPEFFYFTNSLNGQNPIAAVDASTGIYVGSAGLLPGVTFASAKAGDILTLYATGLGSTSPSYSPGQLPTSATSITGTLQVTIGSTTLPAANILYAGISPLSAGLYQINLRLPASLPSGKQPVQVTVNGIASPAGGYITVQ